MYKAKNRVATAILAPIAMLALFATGYPRQSATEANKPTAKAAPIRSEARVGGQRPSRVSSREEKAVRNAYTKLMRYHTAAREKASIPGAPPFGPLAYVTFELSDFRTGPISEILARPVTSLVSPSGNDTLSVTPQYIANGDGPRHAYYDVAWASGPSTDQFGSKRSVNDVLRGTPGKVSAVAKYTSFQVTASFLGKMRTYRALALHEATTESGTTRTEILDNVTSNVNLALTDESPRARSPWESYVRSSLCAAVVRQISQAREGGHPLIPPEAPVGYLPGDDLIGEKTNRAASIAPESACSAVSITPITAVGKGYQAYTEVTLAPSIGDVTLTLGPSTGSGEARFANNSTTMTLNQTSIVTITGITESSTDKNMVLSAQLGGLPIDSINFTVILVTITMSHGVGQAVSPDNAGRDAYRILTGGVSLDTFQAPAGAIYQGFWENGVEILGTVKPSNFQGYVFLVRRIVAEKEYDDRSLLGTNGSCGQPVCVDIPLCATPPCNDITFGSPLGVALIDPDPQSGGSGGKVYDLDGPGKRSAVSVVQMEISRQRYNFRQWAVVFGVSSAGTAALNRVSDDLQWFARVSIRKQGATDVLQTDVPGDNTAGTGTTNTTWNLQ